MEMTSRERVLTAVRGDEVDRPPFALWRHFYDREHSGAADLADAMVGWARTGGFDLLKYNPRAGYHVEPWDGGWPRRPAELSHPVFVEMLDGLRLARAALGDLPTVMTVFTPLAILRRIAGDRADALAAAEGDRLEAALDAVATTFVEFARASLDAGADGIFLATTDSGSRDRVSDGDYARFGRPYDERILEAARGAPLNVLHVCGDRARVLDLADEPHVAAVSWNTHGRENPSLDRLRGRAAVGGISDGALLDANPARVREEIREGLVQTGGRRWLAAGGCTVPPESNERAIRAARDELERKT